MTNTEMYSIEVHDTPVLLKRTLSPGVKLLGERLVQTTDGAGTGSHSQQRLSHFSHFVGACPGHEHLRESLCDVRFIAAIALKGLRVELTRAVSGHVDLLEPTSGGHEITRVRTVAVPFALRATLSPGRSNELVEFFTHHHFDHGPDGALGETTQVLMEDLLFW